MTGTGRTGRPARGGATGRKAGLRFMRIGMFSDSYTPYISGVVRSIQTLRKGIERAGHEVYVFGPRYPSLQPDEEDERVIRFASVAAPLYPQFRIPVPRQRDVREAVARLGLHLLHSHTPFVMGRVALQVARALDRPLCFTFHTRYDVYLQHYARLAGTVLVPALNAYVRRYCNQCQLVIVPTRAIHRRLVELGVHTRVEVLPSGIPVARYADVEPAARARVRCQLGIENDAVLLLYAGRLSREKNLPLLLDAFRLVAARVPGAYLALVGDGPLREDLARQVAAWGLSGRVRFVGAVPPERIPAFYRAADVYAFPSVTETQGLAVIEAMAAGLPVVAVRSEVLEEIVRDGREGLVTRADAADLATACQRLLTDVQLRARLGGAAQAAARAYDSEVILARMLALYEELVTRRRAAHA